jgi:hypothetical protein
MTITETIKGYPGLADVSTAMIEKLCTDRGLSSGASYTAAIKTSVNLTIADGLMAKANDPDYSENDLSVKLHRETLIKSANKLYQENGEVFRVQQPVIRNRTNLW